MDKWFFDCNFLVDEKIFSAASNIEYDNHILSEVNTIIKIVNFTAGSK